MTTWKERLAEAVPDDLGREIDQYESQLELKRQSKIDDKLFAETRLRRGVYGQRYDNGQRHDGIATRTLEFPCGSLTKGPETVWDAPGMQRIKIPLGRLRPEQMEVLADLAEEYSDAIVHITTRQDVQLHYVHIEDTPDIMRRLAAVGITTREACGNTVRNVTACPIAGVCRDETFDITPYAHAAAYFMLGHPDAQDFGRKFKIAFSGCAEHACALVAMHDLGFIARERGDGASRQRGFEVHVGGGLGTVPHQAKLIYDFVEAEEILPLTQAIVRVFARLGEKRNRARARLKFLIAKLGLDEFKRLVEEERAILPGDERWTAYLGDMPSFVERALKPGAALAAEEAADAGFAAWRASNARPQSQEGYAVVTVALPLGDLSAWQLRRLAEIARCYVGDNVRTTVEQNIVLRWVAEADLPELYRELAAAGLAQAGAETIADVTACPGTDTCKLGIASSRGLAGELRRRLIDRLGTMDPAIESLHIKTSGCFNSCGQHHICDLGFYGVSRNVGGTTVPHFQVVLGGMWQENAGSYGLAIGAIPSKRVPDFVDSITERFVTERQGEERFQDYIRRIGKKGLRGVVEEFAPVPAYEEDRSYYSDWRDPREFTISDLGVGECAGEVVDRIDFDLQAAETLAFEAQILLDDGKFQEADEAAYRAMIEAARGLVRLEFMDVPDDPDAIVAEFEKRYCETGLFYDKYAGAKFAGYLLRRHGDKDRDYSQEAAHHLVEEAQLFIESAHACHARVLAAQASGQPDQPAGGR